MRRLENYRHTIAACHTGYISQAIVNNFIPLLFLTFQASYGVSYGMLSLLILINFATQLIIDLLAVKLVDRIGYRPLAVAAHIFIALGLVGIGTLPELLPPFAGLCVPIVVYAMGGGLTEVIISPLVEACPTDKKSASMSLLHSSYCWGSVLVIALSTGFFALFGIRYWKLLSLLWAIVPLLNAVYFLFVPIFTLTQRGESMKPAALLKSRVFLLFILLMLCAGAAEQCISQWASAFVESGLKVSKTVGDLAGPCLFFVLMGTSRVVHAKTDGKVRPVLYLSACAALLTGGYLLTALVKNPAVWDRRRRDVAGDPLSRRGKDPKWRDGDVRPFGARGRHGLRGGTHLCGRNCGGFLARYGAACGGRFPLRPAPAFPLSLSS